MSILTMPAEAMQQDLANSPASPDIPLKSVMPGKGALLALDGRCMNREAFPKALQLSRQFGNRLDILLLNPPKPATLMLGQLLQKLEVAGIDYRLTSGEGDLPTEVMVYVRRFHYISFVMLDCLDKWETRQAPTLAALRQDGYQILTLLDNENKQLISSAEFKGMT